MAVAYLLEINLRYNVYAGGCKVVVIVGYTTAGYTIVEATRMEVIYFQTIAQKFKYIQYL